MTEPAEGLGLPPFGPAYHHVDLAAAAAGANEPRLPVKHGRLRAIAGGVLGRIGFNLMAAIPAPYDEPHAGRGSTAERHRRAGLGFHPRRCRFRAATAARGRSPGVDAGKGALVTVDGGSTSARMASRARIRGDSG
jgi:hypothetical protein